MPDDPRLAQYRKDACQSLMLGEGWRVLLSHLMERIASLDAQAMTPTLDEQSRLHCLGGKQELLYLVNYVCSTAGAPNPFDTQRSALWSTLGPPALPATTLADEDATEDAKRALVAKMAQERKRRAGSVA